MIFPRCLLFMPAHLHLLWWSLYVSIFPAISTKISLSFALCWHVILLLRLKHPLTFLTIIKLPPSGPQPNSSLRFLHYMAASSVYYAPLSTLDYCPMPALANLEQMKLATYCCIFSLLYWWLLLCSLDYFPMPVFTTGYTGADATGYYYISTMFPLATVIFLLAKFVLVVLCTATYWIRSHQSPIFYLLSPSN